MVEQKLRAIQENPEHVREGLFRVTSRTTPIHVTRELLQFFWSWIAGEGGEKERGDTLLRVPSWHIHNRSQDLTLLQAGNIGDELAIHQHQGLEDGGVGLGGLLVRGKALTEASGGVNLNTVRAIAETGVDFISAGALTHSAAAVDLALT